MNTKNKTWHYGPYGGNVAKAIIDMTPQGFFVLADDIGEFEKNWHCGPTYPLDFAVYGPFLEKHEAQKFAVEVAVKVVS